MLRRWYWIVGGVLAGLMMLAQVVVVVVVMQTPSMSMQAMERWGAVTRWAAYPFVPVLIPWTLWLCPWLAANDPHVVWPRHPKVQVKGLQVLVWIPAGCCVFFAGLCMLGNIVDRVPVGRWMWHKDPFGGLGRLSVVLLVPLVLWSWWLSRQVKRRFRATMASRITCWRCGYDLRGNPAATACPECGEAIVRGAEAAEEERC